MEFYLCRHYLCADILKNKMLNIIYQNDNNNDGDDFNGIFVICICTKKNH